MLKPGKKLKGKLDYKDGISRMGGDSEFFHSLLSAFIQAQSDYKNKITTALDQSETTSAIKAAHTLKGTAGNLSLISIHKAAESLEITLKENPADKTAIDKAVNNLFFEMETVLPEVKDLIS